MLSNIPSKSDKNGAAEFKHQKLCDLDYYSRFSREELRKPSTIFCICTRFLRKTPAFGLPYRSP